VQFVSLSYFVRGCTNCTDPTHPDAAAAEPAAAAGPVNPQHCTAALEKDCPGLAHKGVACHDCAFNHTAALATAGCNMTGSPPPDIMHYCMPSGSGGGVKHPHGAFVVEYQVLPADAAAGQGAPGRRRAEEGPSSAWRSLRTGSLAGGGAVAGGPAAAWRQESWALPEGKLQVRFSCSGATRDGSNYCALDSVKIAGK
jgi:hypothetical protein